MDDKTFKKWRKGLKQKMQDNPFGYPPPINVIKLPQNDVNRAFGKLFVDEDEMTKFDQKAWRIVFPKIADDLIEPKRFKENVLSAVGVFVNANFPVTKKVAPGIKLEIETLVVSPTVEPYPDVFSVPIWHGKRVELEEYLKPIHQWSGNEFYWKGSFVKSRTTGKIVSIRLTNLSFNIPDKYLSGQPISFNEVNIF